MKTLHVKKGDTVKILTGKDRGKRGTIVKTLPREERVVVDGLNLIKKHVKKEGIIDMPRPIHVSNVVRVEEKKKEGKKKESKK